MMILLIMACMTLFDEGNDMGVSSNVKEIHHYDWIEFGQYRKIDIIEPLDWKGDADFGIPLKEFEQFTVDQVPVLNAKYNLEGWQFQNIDNALTMEPLYPKQLHQSDWILDISQKVGHSKSQLERIYQYAQFVQSFEYVQIPDTVDNRVVAGLYSIEETLLQQKGDCDALVLAFAALLLREDIPLILIKGVVDGVNHVVLGVQIQAMKGDLIVEFEEEIFVVFDMTISNNFTEQQRNLLKNGQYAIDWLHR